MGTNGMYNSHAPLAPAYAVFCFPSEPNIPEGPEYENITRNIDPQEINTLEHRQTKSHWIGEI